jgi:GST-like protein
VEEMELKYNVHVVDLTKSANFAPEFMALSPTAKVPVIVDHDAAGGKPHTVFESGAILLYIWRKRPEGFSPANPSSGAMRFSG